MTQLPGKDFKASDVSYTNTRSGSQLSLNIGKAYSEDAGINTWKRTVRLNRGKNVQVTDVISLKRADKITQHMMTCYPSEVSKPGELVIHYYDKEKKPLDFIVRYSPKQLEAIVEKIPLTTMEDQGIIQKWGDRIYRINFNVLSPKAADKINIEIAEK
jgi:hypothetical protein